MDWLTWVVIGIVAVVLIAMVIFFIIKFCKMSAEEKKEVIVELLVGLVTIAEQKYVGEGMGKDKVAWVEERFKETAPWLLKIFLAVTKSISLTELIEKALAKAKEVEWDKFKATDGQE